MQRDTGRASVQIMIRLAMCLLALGLFACAGPRAQTVISLLNVSCQSCGVQSVDLLQQTEGVYAASFDKAKAEIAVSFNPDHQSPNALAKVVSSLGYQTVVGAGKGSYGGETEFTQKSDLKILTSTGEDLELKDHLVAGKVTVFDFFAVWCGPCKQVDKAMAEILAGAPDVAYRKINIVDWKSAVSKRYLGKVPELPYVIIYGKDGQQIVQIAGLDLVRLRTSIETARAQ
jgi:thiol-disulfide isomerase/thioredoxin